MSNPHPIYIPNTLLTAEMVRLNFLRDHATLRQMALDAIADITPSNFEETGPKALVLVGLWDAMVAGHACRCVSDTTNS